MDRNDARPHQYPLGLIDRGADEILADRLAFVVELFNATTDAAERVELHGEITRLRRLLAPTRGSEVRRG